MDRNLRKHGPRRRLALLRTYNSEPFHLIHALTVEGVMKWYAEQLGYGADAGYWGVVGLLHDIDFEQYPEEHCKKAVELLSAAKVPQRHPFGVQPRLGPVQRRGTHPPHGKGAVRHRRADRPHRAAARMRPSKSVQDMELSSLKKKFKDKRFAAGCSRESFKKGPN